MTRKQYDYQLTPVEAACPVCFHTGAHVLYYMESRQAAGHVFSETREGAQFLQLQSHIETLWHGTRCAFLRCDDCQFCFASPNISGDSLLYKLVYQGDGAYQAWKWEFQNTYLKLQDLGTPGVVKDLKLLEIGAGNGAFVRKIAGGLLPRQNIVCLEYSNSGLESIRKQGIQCLSLDVRELDLMEFERHFDVVCMFQVLEHMDRLDALFERLTRLTGEKASLFIAVPNSAQREYFDLHGVIEDTPPMHIGRWNRRAFEIIGARHGWKVTGHETEPQTFFSKTHRFLMMSFVKSKVAVLLTQVRSRPLRRLLKFGYLCLFSLLLLPAVMGLASNKLGVSQWVHLQKELE